MGQKIKKGIILAGGSGTRLYPITKVISKQLLPVYDKPMIYYPLSVLMLSGIKDILIISTPRDLPYFEMLFNDGSDLGLNISYLEQPNPDGLAQAFILGESFIGSDGVCLILGDNIFYGHDLSSILESAIQLQKGGLIFGYAVKDPKRYGVVEFDEDMNATDIIEKPKNPRSEFAVPGLYFYDNTVVDVARNLKPSPRGELEITDVNRKYLQDKKLRVQILGRGFAWLDTGTPEALQQAASYIQAIQERQGFKIACIEEIAYRKGFIDGDSILKRSADMFHNEYGQYLKKVVDEISH